MIALGRLLIAMALLALAGITVGAQSYHIRIEYNTNIRAEPSLNGRRIETAPAGTVLEVLSQSNRWLRVNRSGGAWIAAWVSHQRVDAAPAVSNPADTDNCCGINRVCRSDQEWVAGYWDFQRGLCSLPAQTSHSPAPAVSDNCCGIDRECRSDQEWKAGYWDFQRGTCRAQEAVATGGNCCDLAGWNCRAEHEWTYGYWQNQHNRCTPVPAPPPFSTANRYSDHGHINIIEISGGFRDKFIRAFELLRARTPHYYKFVVNAATEVREFFQPGGASGVQGASGKMSYNHLPYTANDPRDRQRDIFTAAGWLVHEACHVYQDRQGRGVGGANSWLNEYECELYQRDFAGYVPGFPVYSNIHSAFLADPLNRVYWWWSP